MNLEEKNNDVEENMENLPEDEKSKVEENLSDKRSLPKEAHSDEAPIEEAPIEEALTAEAAVEEESSDEEAPTEETSAEEMNDESPSPDLSFIIGKKIGMTRLFDDSGTNIPVTVIEAGPCPVVQIKTTKNDGYNAGIVYTVESTDTDPTTMTSLFGGFAGMGLRIGGEYDIQTEGNVESNIVSVSANYAVRENIDFFARYDIFDSDKSIEKNSENYLITGIVLTCDVGISIAPNLRMINYENTAKESETEYRANFQFKF